MTNIREIHESILQFLLNYKEIHPDFTFGLRKMNNSNRLREGFWFNGNENYVAIPFWTGRDWKNKTPNIFFKIGIDGSSFLEFSFLDSFEKRILIDRIKENINNIESNGRGYIKNYHTKDFIRAIADFIDKDKPIIDELIKVSPGIFPSSRKGYERIDFYSEEEFQKSLRKINSFRFAIDQEIGLSQYVKSIEIINERPKINVKINDIPKNARWIFFTGKNGVGKSSILKAVAAAINEGKLPSVNGEYIYSIIPNSTSVDLNLMIDKRSINLNLSYGIPNINPIKPVFTGYGPIRQLTHKVEKGELTEEKAARFATGRSLFFDDALMYNLDMELFTTAFAEKQGINPNGSLAKYVLIQIIEFLPTLIPGLKRIEVPYESTIEDLWSETEYIFEDENEQEFRGVTFEYLSSGHKNLINFLGDMLIRLFDQQAINEDLTELKGIVIIDEIDIHLHPIYQKSLVETLADTFPNIQFLVSTHSPIPLLGAPKGSYIYKVKRNAEEGIIAERVDDKIYLMDLLPNAILTSPIFGMDDIVNSMRDPTKMIVTEDNYAEIEFTNQLRSRIDNFLSDKKQEELIKLFESRKK